jgi:hypothetical protein
MSLAGPNTQYTQQTSGLNRLVRAALQGGKFTYRSMWLGCWEGRTSLQWLTTAASNDSAKVVTLHTDQSCAIDDDDEYH